VTNDQWFGGGSAPIFNVSRWRVVALTTFGYLRKPSDWSDGTVDGNLPAITVTRSGNVKGSSGICNPF